MATDPICGMTIDEKTAKTAVRDGVTAYFCSEDCRRKFLGDELLSPASSSSAAPCCGSHRPTAGPTAGRADADAHAHWTRAARQQ